MKSFLLLVLTAAVSIASPALTFADTIVFDRGLPTANLNNAAGASRSNVAWTDSDFATGWFVGDDFTIGGTGTTVVSDLRVWVVGTTSGTYNNNNYAGAAFSLWTGAEGALTDPLSMSSTPGVLSGPILYADSTTYQGSSGAFLNLYALDFSGLNWTVDNATTYRFGVSALAGSSYVPVFLHASNAPLSGSPQQGADGSYLGFDPNNWALNYTCDSGNPVTCGGWDKSSDINVQIAAVPEPGSMMLFGTGLIAVATKVRNRRLKK